MTPCMERYMSELKSRPPMTRAEEAALMACGDRQKIRDELVNRNARFVVRIAMHYKYVDHPIEDIVAAGNVGLLRATDTFTPDAGVRFISYAVHWIKQSIRKELGDKASTVRRPMNITRTLAGIYEAKRECQREGVEPADHVVADMVGIPVERYRKVMWNAARRKVSLDSPMGPRDGEVRVKTLHDCIADEEVLMPDEAVERAVAGDVLGRVMGRIGERERMILTECVMNDRTMQSVADDMSLSKERVRQLKNKGLDDLRRELVIEKSKCARVMQHSP